MGLSSSCLLRKAKATPLLLFMTQEINNSREYWFESTDKLNERMRRVQLKSTSHAIIALKQNFWIKNSTKVRLLDQKSRNLSKAENTIRI